MSRRARLFSEFLDGSDVGGLTTAPTASSISQDVIAKRRKTSGLNSRFDRMIETINLTHRSATRKRARSTSSASGSSVPKTPIDDYDDVHRDARLGAEFSVIKMGDKKKVKRPVVLPWEQDSSSSDIAEPPPAPKPLPSWLASTFSTLNTQHPLRLLLPRRTNSAPVLEDAEEDASLFSFSVPVPADPLPSNEAENIPEPPPEPTQTPPRPTEAAYNCRPSSPPSASFDPALPFSTPGPGSAISFISDSMPLPIYVPELVYAQYAPPAFVPMLQIHLPEPAYDHCAPSSFAPRPHSTPPLKTTASFADLYPDHREHGIIHEHYAPSSFAPRLHSTPPKFSAPKTTAPSTDFYPDHREHAISHDHCTSSFASLLHSPSPEFSAAQSTDFYPHHGNHATSPAKSDHSAYIDLYSTPGPGYRTVPPVYFDSPTEDPSDSDPMMEPAYELDSLDFRWAPFIQKGDNGNQNRDGDVAPAPQTPPPRATVTVNNGGDDYYYETRVEPEGEDDVDGQLYASINLGNERCLSPSQDRFSFAPPAEDLASTDGKCRGQNQNSPATPPRPFFAPAGGIFISPLRGDEAPKTPPKIADSVPNAKNPHSSQVSTDSIEDWDDDDTAAN